MRPAAKKYNKKARRLTYNISVVAGFIGILIILKGFYDMHRRMRAFVYFDRVIEARSDTLVHDALGNRYRLRAGGTLKYFTRRPSVVVIDGEAAFDVTRPVRVLLPDTVRITAGSGYLRSGRFPRIWLNEGQITVGQRSLEGKKIFWNGRHARFDVDSTAFFNGR